MVTGCPTTSEIAYWGLRGIRPEKWTIWTRRTSGAGELNRKVSRGLFNVSPRCRIALVGAYTVTDEASVRTSKAETGEFRTTPGLKAQ